MRLPAFLRLEPLLADRTAERLHAVGESGRRYRSTC